MFSKFRFRAVLLMLVVAGCDSARQSKNGPGTPQGRIPTGAELAQYPILPASRSDSSVRAVDLALFNGPVPVLQPLHDADASMADSIGPLFQIVGTFLTSEKLVVGEGSTRAVHFLTYSGDLRSFGRQGNGPGEFQKLTRIMRYRNDSALAVDQQLRRFTVIASDGQHGSTMPFPTSSRSSDRQVVPIAATRTGTVYYAAREINKGAANPRDRRLQVDIFSGTTSSVGDTRIMSLADALVHEGPGTDLGEISFGGKAQFAASDSTFLALAANSVDLLIFGSDGRMTETIDLRIPRTLVSQKEVEAERTRRIREMELQLKGVPELFREGFRNFLRTMNVPDTLPATSGLIAGVEGTVLIELFAPNVAFNTIMTYLFLNATRTEITRFRLSSGSRAFALNGNRIAAVHTDQDGLETLEFYRIPLR